jgi:flagellar biogenesis protein FliO
MKGMAKEKPRVSASDVLRRMIALWERVLRISRRAPRRLRLCENLPLGERRFVAVVEFDAARFLVGGTPSSLVLLSRLSDAGNAAESGCENESHAALQDARRSQPKPPCRPETWTALREIARKGGGGKC